MNKNRFLTWMIVALTLLNIGSTTFFMTRKTVSRIPEGARKTIIERLRFDQKQVDDYEKLIQEHRADIRRKDTELSAARQAVYQQLLGEDFSKKDSLAAEVGRLQTAVQLIHLAHFRDIKSLCRADQLADFNALVGDLAKYFPGPKGKKKMGGQ